MARTKKKSTAPAQPDESSDISPRVYDLSADESARLDELLESTTPSESLQEAIDAGDTEESDRATASRARRLARAGCPLLTCGVLGSDLDVGPRSVDRAHPVRRVGDEWVSTAGATILDLGLTPDELEHAAEWLRARAGA